jgi:hypothetical protein
MPSPKRAAFIIHLKHPSLSSTWGPKRPSPVSSFFSNNFQTPYPLHLLFLIPKQCENFHHPPLWAQATRPPRSASPSLGHQNVVREAEQRFLLLFLEKEEYNWSEKSSNPEGILGACPQTPWVGFAESWASKRLPREAE